MKRILLNVKKSFIDYQSFRLDITDRQFKAVRVFSLLSVLYSILTPLYFCAFREGELTDFLLGCTCCCVLSLAVFVSTVIVGKKEGSMSLSREKFATYVEWSICILVITVYVCTLYVNASFYSILSLIVVSVFIFHPVITISMEIVVSVILYLMLAPGKVSPDPKEHIMKYILILLALFIVTFMKYIEEYENYIKKCDLARTHDDREKFMANLTHEMRTPLNAVLGKNQLILGKTKEEATKKLCLEINSGGKILLSLINDILDWSKLESGNMKIVPANYDFASISQEIEGIMRSEVESRELKFICEYDDDIPSVLYGDDVRLKQIIMNLLSNAMKYTNQGSVTLRIQCVRIGRPDENILNAGNDVLNECARMQNKNTVINDDDCILRFSVEDTGIGIKEEDMSTLLDAYARVENGRNRKVTGTGLGLSITSTLLNLMDSKLQIESTYGVGSVFSFELKQKVIDYTPHSKKKKNDSKGHLRVSDVKILVVDDNRVNFGVCAGLLKLIGAKAEYAGNGLMCLEKLKLHEYDMIFLDHMMPEMDGIETLKKIQSGFYNVFENVPIIALTANCPSDADAVYKNYGFSSYLPKPIEAERLEQILIGYLPSEKKNYITD